jgi:hypothetical protein
LVQSYGRRDTTKEHLTAASLVPRIKYRYRPRKHFVLVTNRNHSESSQHIRNKYFLKKPLVHATHRFDSNDFVAACSGCDSFQLRSHHDGTIRRTLAPPLVRLHNEWKDPRSYRQGEWNFDRTMSTVIAAYPWLFQHRSIQHLCMICKCRIDHGGFTVLGKVFPYSGLCRECARGNSVFIRWCRHCHGKPGPLQIARMYWQTQHEVPMPSCFGAKGPPYKHSSRYI